MHITHFPVHFELLRSVIQMATQASEFAIQMFMLHVR